MISLLVAAEGVVAEDPLQHLERGVGRHRGLDHVHACRG